MSVATEKSKITPDELLAMPDSTNFDLVNGESKERHMRALSSWVGGRLFIRLGAFVETNQLGWVFPSDNG